MNEEITKLRPCLSEKSLGKLVIPYDEKIKNATVKREITKRWRMLGLTECLKPNSKSEKNTIEGYERMACCLINRKDENDNIDCTHMFQTVIFPVICLMYGTGEKLTGKKLYSVVKAEEMYELLQHTTMKDVMRYVRERVPKSNWAKLDMMSRLIEYKQIADVPITQLDYHHLRLTDDEHGLLTALFQQDGKRGFDFEADLLLYIPSYLVFYLSDQKKKESCEE